MNPIEQVKTVEDMVRTFLGLVEPKYYNEIVQQATIKLLQNSRILSSSRRRGAHPIPFTYGGVWHQLENQISAALSGKKFPRPPKNLTDEDVYNITELANSIDAELKYPEFTYRRGIDNEYRVNLKAQSRRRGGGGPKSMDTSGISPQKLASLARGEENQN